MRTRNPGGGRHRHRAREAHSPREQTPRRLHETAAWQDLIGTPDFLGDGLAIVTERTPSPHPAASGGQERGHQAGPSSRPSTRWPSSQGHARARGGTRGTVLTASPHRRPSQPIAQSGQGESEDVKEATERIPYAKLAIHTGARPGVGGGATDTVFEGEPEGVREAIEQITYAKMAIHAVHAQASGADRRLPTSRLPLH